MSKWRIVKKKSGHRYYFREFDSIDEMVGCRVSKEDREQIGNGADLNDIKVAMGRKKAADPEWYGHHEGNKGALKIARYAEAWAEGHKLINEASEGLDIACPRVKRRKRKRCLGPQGASVNMDQVWAGNLDRAWHTFKRETREGAGNQCVRFYVNVGGNCGISAKEMVWPAAAVAIAAKVLEQAGVPTEIIGCSAGENFAKHAKDKEYCSQLKTFPLKKEGEPLDLDRIIRFTCHAGIYRTVGFKVIFSVPGVRTTWGLGRARPFEWMAKKAGVKLPEGAIVGPFSEDCKTSEDALKWLTKTLKPFGLEEK